MKVVFASAWSLGMLLAVGMSSPNQHVSAAKKKKTGKKKNKKATTSNIFDTAATSSPPVSLLATVSRAAKSSKTEAPTQTPSMTPTASPSETPTRSAYPSFLPSDTPSDEPSKNPSTAPSDSPSETPSVSVLPSTQPSDKPSTAPSDVPSVTPSVDPSSEPSSAPSSTPSTAPSDRPSQGPTQVTLLEGSMLTVNGNSGDNPEEYPFNPKYCGTSITTPGKIFKVVGTGNFFTATLNGSPDYDPKLSLFQDSFSNCLGGMDDNRFIQSEAPILTWSTTAGRSYLLFVHGFNDQSGPFTLEVTTSNTPPAFT